MLKRLFSYIFPFTIFKQNSAISKSLEVTWVNGKLVLDTTNTNYSYGSLQRILRKGLLYIGFDRIQAMNNILVLGVAGGSVIKTLVDEIHFEGKITGVEIDEAVIQIANDYFQLNQIPNLEIVIADAFEFVLKSKEQYDLIIIDIFQDTTMPGFLFETYFTDRLSCILKSKGCILFNTMLLNESQKQLNLNFFNAFTASKYKANKLHKLEEFNELIIVESLT